MLTQLKPPLSERLTATPQQIAEFCQRWQITEFALFGSVLRHDFHPESDIDVLVTFSPDSRWSLFDWVDMQAELASLLQRPVDIADKEGLTNPYRRSEILQTHQVVYARQQS